MIKYKFVGGKVKRFLGNQTSLKSFFSLRNKRKFDLFYLTHYKSIFIPFFLVIASVVVEPVETNERENFELEKPKFLNE